MTPAQAHMGRVASLGCIVCRRLRLGTTPAEVHHLRKDGWGRASDFETMPLCFTHHRGADGIHHLGVKRWERRFWDQRELLEQTLAELAECSR